MPSGKIVPFDALSGADLVVDAVYQSGRKGNHSDDPISHILKVSNQGGFRYRGSLDSLDLVALVSSLNDPDQQRWPLALSLLPGDPLSGSSTRRTE